MPISFVEMIILIITHLNHAIFDPKGFSIIVTNFMMVNFNSPILQIFPIE